MLDGDTIIFPKLFDIAIALPTAASVLLFHCTSACKRTVTAATLPHLERYLISRKQKGLACATLLSSYL